MKEAPVEPSRRQVHLRDYLRTIWRGRWTVVAITLAVLTISLVATLLSTPIYRATVTVEVQPQARRIMTGEDMTGLGVQGYSWTAEDRYIKTQLEILKSRSLAQQVVEEHLLDQDLRFPESNDPIATLINLVQVRPREGTGILEISIAGPDAEAITQWVNGVAVVYIDRNVEQARKTVDIVLKDVHEQLHKMKDDLEDAQEKHLTLAREDGILDVAGQQLIINQEISRLTQEHAEARKDATELSRKRDTVNGLLEGVGNPMLIEEVAKDATVQGLIAKKSEVDKEIAQLAVTRRPGHPDYQRALSELESIESQLAAQYRAILDRMRSDYDSAVEREKYLQTELSLAQLRAVKFGEDTSQYVITQADVDARNRIYDTVVTRLQEINLSAGVMSNNIRIVDPAIVPTRTVSPRKVMNLAGGLILGLLLGLGTVFFLDYLDNTIKSAEDLEHELGLQALAVIPRRRTQTSQAVKEALQTLRTSVLFSSQGRTLNVLLVTSAGPREGKSSTVADLAETLAMSGEKVALVDCDLRRPTMHSRFNLERDHGLSNYLVTREVEDWAGYMKEASTPNLSVFTCGPLPPNPPDLFNSKRFRNLLDQLKQSFDWVLIDSPPVISLTDAIILASLVDMVALVVKHNENDQEMIFRCLQQVRNVNANVIGAVLNCLDIQKEGYYYSGYYYQRDGERKKRRRRVRRSAEASAEGAPGDKADRAG